MYQEPSSLGPMTSQPKGPMETMDPQVVNRILEVCNLYHTNLPSIWTHSHEFKVLTLDPLVSTNNAVGTSTSREIGQPGHLEQQTLDVPIA